MYVCNVAGESGETEGYSLVDHLDVIRNYVGDSTIDLMIANNNLEQVHNQAYADLIPGEWESDGRVKILFDDVIDEIKPSQHDSSKLAFSISEAYRQHRGKRRRLPRLRRNSPLSL